MPRRVKVKVRTGSRLVRLNDETIALLDDIRKRSLRAYSSYDQLIHRLAFHHSRGGPGGAGGGGIPQPSRIAPVGGGVPTTRDMGRSPAGGPVPARAEGSAR